MQIIGIAGRAGSGKSEVARMVGANLDCEVIAFADELKELAQDYFNWDCVKDERGRRLLQVLGTDCGRAYDPQIWVRKWREKVQYQHETFGPISIIADDVRFENEAAEIHRMGGVLVRVVKPDINADKMSDHVSEQPIPRSYIDYTIQNDGNLEQLRGQVEILLRELAKREGE